ncbi:MlaA family lipoprotein [Oceanibium sediminis]|uniref:MlaA family lipoprotein n=1 Tax=Oceanibium sediminis TaxID=2026339 RepID=UPI0013008FFA|nr:VacJ family lipoprotein [Oceanibium sediminis]
MTSPNLPRIHGIALRATVLAGLLVVVTGCAGPQTSALDVDDPWEERNRKVHAFNKALDRSVVKPLSDGYVAAVPSPVRTGVSNGVNNLGQPAAFINHLLQGDIDDAGASFARFGMNTVFGLGGLLDPATDAGVFDRPTDFGETLAVWGVASGPYVERPVLGPSTVRDSFGRIVEFVADPANNLVRSVDPDITGYVIAARVGNVLQVRNDLDRVINALYYESADSYTAARIAYLQNRSRAVNDGVADIDLEDPNAFD